MVQECFYKYGVMILEETFPMFASRLFLWRGKILPLLPLDVKTPASPHWLKVMVNGLNIAERQVFKVDKAPYTANDNMQILLTVSNNMEHVIKCLN